MIAAAAPNDVDCFRGLISNRFGLHFDEGRTGTLADVLRRRAGAHGLDADAYLRTISAEIAPAEARALASELTVGETYFLRNIEQFRALSEVPLPESRDVVGGSRPLRVLSAGCASGEEAYSLAMVLRQRFGEPGLVPAFTIRAVDMNAAMLERAREGRYSSWSLRETPPEFRQRWFRGEGREFRLDPSICAAVQFSEHNLVAEDPELWRPEGYDVVFCRNVIMYFAPETAAKVVERIAHALVPGGYLFLGHAETLRGLSHDFHLHHTHGTFYYQRKGSHAASPPGNGAGSWSLAAEASEAVSSTSWIESIRDAAERIRQLSERPVPVAVVEPFRADKPAMSARLDGVVDLLEKERFADALAILHGLPPETGRGPDALLLRAVLLTHDGRLAEARDACNELLAADELSAGAHYLLALCREGSGDRNGAIDHDQIAIYLDGTFAMPRLHLGLMAKRAGDRAGAHQQLGQAIALLRREEPARLLLFGGGFSREALIGLCEAELVATGGRP